MSIQVNNQNDAVISNLMDKCENIGLAAEQIILAAKKGNRLNLITRTKAELDLPTLFVSNICMPGIKMKIDTDFGELESNILVMRTA